MIFNAIITLGEFSTRLPLLCHTLITGYIVPRDIFSTQDSFHILFIHLTSIRGKCPQQVVLRKMFKE